MSSLKNLMTKKGNNSFNKVSAVTANNLKGIFSYIINTEIEFMDLLSKLYGESIEENSDQKNVGQINNSADSNSHLCFVPNKAQESLLKLYLKQVYNKDTKNTKGKIYKGLITKEIEKNKQLLKLTMVSTRVEESLIEEIYEADLTIAANRRKIILDLNKIFRMYHELGIDAPKKLYKFATFFYSDVFRAESTLRLSHGFLSFRRIAGTPANKYQEAKEPVPFDIYRVSKYVLPVGAEVGSFEVFKNEKEEIKKILFKDLFASIADDSIAFLKEKINVDLLEYYKLIKLSDQLINSFELGGENGKIIADIYYNFICSYNLATSRKAIAMENLDSEDLTSEERAIIYNRIMQAYEEEIRKIDKRLKFFLNEFSRCKAGELVFVSSNVRVSGGNPSINEDSTNQFFLKVCSEEFLTYFISKFATNKVAEYKLLGSDAQYVEENELVELVDGVAIDGRDLFVKGNYTGTMTVQKTDDNIKLIVPIVEVLENRRRDYDIPETWNIQLLENKFVDAYEFNSTKEIKYITYEKFNTERYNLLKKCVSIKIMPVWDYINSKGKKTYLYDVVIATVLNKNTNTLIEIPVGKYTCYSSSMERKIAGLLIKQADILLENTIVNLGKVNIEVNYKNAEFEEVRTTKANSDNPFTSNSSTKPNYQNKNNSFEDVFGIENTNQSSQLDYDCDEYLNTKDEQSYDFSEVDDSCFK